MTNKSGPMLLPAMQTILAKMVAIPTRIWDSVLGTCSKWLINSFKNEFSSIFERKNLDNKVGILQLNAGIEKKGIYFVLLLNCYFRDHCYCLPIDIIKYCIWLPKQIF